MLIIMKTLFKLMFSIIGVLWVLPLYSSATGLIVIPIADCVGDKNLKIEYTLDLAALNVDDIPQAFVNSEYGIGKRFELGVDIGLTSRTAKKLYGNFKYIPIGQPGVAAFAVGIQTIQAEDDSAGYIVYSRQLKLLRTHLGMQELNRKITPFLGVDHLLSGDLDINIDWTGGKQNYWSIGFVYNLDSGFGGQLGLLVPNNSKAPGYMNLQISWIFSL